MRFSEAYRNAMAQATGVLTVDLPYVTYPTCPIESGFLHGLADLECGHGRLPGDRTPPCGCWSEKPR